MVAVVVRTREQFEACLRMEEPSADRELESLSLSLSWGPAYLYPDGIFKYKEEEGLEGGINREATPKQPCNWGSGAGRRNKNRTRRRASGCVDNAPQCVKVE